MLLAENLFDACITHTHARTRAHTHTHRHACTRVHIPSKTHTQYTRSHTRIQ